MKNFINNNAVLIQLITAGLIITLARQIDIVGFILIGYTFAGGKIKV